ncbi:MAG: SagB/ThcOx family dehydrogenase [Bacteroidales bacterium]|jgi:SagB-type dehydrogenase family enzyme|nr:SagB/ThcOx family dehydrogenase [Bacteroidales bacterium]
MKNLVLSLTVLLSLCACAFAQDITLPAPDKKGGKPLMQALNERKSVREFTADNLTQQQLSDLLWAACGVNRPDKRRTAPSAMNNQEIDVYVAMQSGLYLYDAGAHVLKLVKNKDVRRYTGTQSFVNNAAVNLVYVANMGRTGIREGAKINDADLFMSYSDAAFIAQNVYLYCASANLGCIVRGAISKESLATELGLKSNHVILLAQTVGGMRR